MTTKFNNVITYIKYKSSDLSVSDELAISKLIGNKDIKKIEDIYKIFYNFFEEKTADFLSIKNTTNRNKNFNLTSSDFFYLDKIKIKKYSNNKFKQNYEIIFECEYEGIKLLLFLHNKGTNSKIYNYNNYPMALILHSKTSHDEGDLKESFKRFRISTSISTSTSIQSTPIINHSMLDIIKQNITKIKITDILNNYNEYDIISKKFDDGGEINIILTEYYDGNYFDFLTNYINDDDENKDEKIYNSLIQIFIALINFYNINESNITNKVLYPHNFFYRELDINIQEYFIFQIDNSQYILQNMGFMLVVFYNNLKESLDTNNLIIKSFLNILRRGLYKRYLYNGSNNLIVELVTELLIINKDIKQFIKTIFKIFSKYCKSFKIINN